MTPVLDLATVRDFGTALLIGALIGLEREKHRAAEGDVDAVGLRTMILLAEIGAIGGWLARSFDAPWLVVAALAVGAVPVVAGYVMTARTTPAAFGVTSETAALAVCLLGAVTTLGHAALAVCLGVVTAAVLAYKQPLHGLVDRLGWDDVFAGLRLLIAAFVVLPLLPDRPVDPWGALNPSSLWTLVLLISSLSLVGYVATRWLGEKTGVFLTGLTGGLVSSTAVTLSFARRSREDPDASGMAKSLASGILLAWTVMFGRVIVEVAVVNAALLARVLVPFVAMMLVAAATAVVFLRRSSTARGEPGTAQSVPLKNPFSLTAAVKFAGFFAVVLLVVKMAEQYVPGKGQYVVAALAGLTDVDAITLSMAEYAKTGQPGVAVNAIVIASLTNTLVKAGLAAGLGGPGLRRHVLVGTAAILAAGVAAIVLL